MTKTAVILFNLGGPDNQKSIAPFLTNFFMDANIIAAPFPVRFLLSRYIAYTRSRKEAGSSYEALGYKSPLLDNTKAQAGALSEELGEDFKIFITMRYWHPFAEDVVKEVALYNPDHVVLLPLYPQYSTTTTKSSLQEWIKAAEKINFTKPTSMRCCYPADNGFIAASAANVTASYKKMFEETGKAPRVLFSAHGLPEKIIASGDPYQSQCEDSARQIVKAMGIDNLDWQICYQSRVGPLKWIGPSTSQAIAMAAKDGKDIVIYPHAFVSEHVETLVEIEMEYRHEAHEAGIKNFARVPTVMIHPLFIKGLADIVRSMGVATGLVQPRICSPRHGKCCRAEFETCGLWGKDTHHEAAA